MEVARDNNEVFHNQLGTSKHLAIDALENEALFGKRGTEYSKIRIVYIPASGLTNTGKVPGNIKLHGYGSRGHGVLPLISDS